MAKKSIRTLRDEYRKDVFATAARRTQLTPEIEEKLETAVLAKYPYQPDELEGFTTEVILTLEEILAAAMAVGVIDLDTACAKLQEEHARTYGFLDGPVDHASARDIDVTAMSNLPAIDSVRTSVARRTTGTEWAKFGAVFLYRPMHERKNKETDKMLDDILGG